MSSGHKGDDPAPVSSVLRALQMNPGLQQVTRRQPWVDRGFRVPYLAGPSIDGQTVYVDSQTPERLPKSGIEPDEYYAAHEVVERWLMVMRGMPYERAHLLAHGYERLRMKLAGISDERIEQYEAESSDMWHVDEHLKLAPEAFPPDLFLGPYEDGDELDEKLLPLLRQAQFVKRSA